MATKKQETQLNRLWDKIKSLDLTQDEINYMNMRGFLYSVGRINILQCVAIMTDLCISHGLSRDEIVDLLKD